MKRVLLVAVLLASCCGFASVAQARTLYELQWQSDFAIDATTIVIDVQGSNGKVVGTAMADEGRAGYVWIDADRACLSVAWRAQTMAGMWVSITRRWDTECYRTHLPISAQDTPFAALP